MELLLHLAGTGLGATTLVAALQLSNSLIHMPKVAALVITIAASSSAVLGFRVPHSRWMVPKSWARYGRRPYNFLFAFILGLGYLTVVPGFGMYALGAFMAVAPVGTALAVGVTFGISRGLGPLVEARAVARSDGWHAAQAATLRAQFAVSLEPPILVAVALAMLVTA